MALKPEELIRTSAFLKNAHRERQPSREPEAVAPPIPKPAKAPPQGRHAPQLHFPRAERPAEPKVYPMPPRVASPSPFTCQKCASPRLKVTYGQYSYYFKCLACEGNTRIDLKRDGCGGKLKTRKSKNEFFAECKTCETSKLYFTNPG